MALPVIELLKRSEEHTSELQSHLNLVCRLLLEKKKKNAVLHGYMLALGCRLVEPEWTGNRLESVLTRGSCVKAPVSYSSLALSALSHSSCSSSDCMHITNT